MTGGKPVRLLLADGQPLLRSGLRAVLGTEPDLAVVGEAGDGAEAVDLARRLLPDVVLMDMQLPRMDGVAATRAIVGARLPVGVLLLASSGSDDGLVSGLRAGASGLLLKNAPAEDLLAGVRTVAAGGAVMTPALLRQLLDRLATALPAEDTPAPPQLEVLTTREREVLMHVARGQNNGEIARALSISETTVKTHVGNVLTKLGLRDRVQAVVLAYESGLVRPRG